MSAPLGLRPRRIGLIVPISAHALLGRLGLPPMIDGAGWLLAGRHLAAAALRASA